MSTPTETVESSLDAALRARSLVERGALALVVSVLAVALVRAIAGALLAVPPAFGPTQWGPALGFTAFAAVVATLVYAALDRFTARTDRNFVAVAVIVTLAMLVPVATVAPSIPGATTALQAVLVVFHLVAGVGITVPLVRGFGPVR